MSDVPVLIGYFPKRIMLAADLDWFAAKAPHLVDICSVSECISPGPPEWIGQWLHNAHWVFSSPQRATRVLPAESPERYEVLAYRSLPVYFDEGKQRELDLSNRAVIYSPTDDDPLEPLPDSFESLGFDAVIWENGCSSFGCSPLSCNHGYEKYATNAHCLLPSVEQAKIAAADFSKNDGSWEPGIYRVIEVCREQSSAPR